MRSPPRLPSTTATPFDRLEDAILQGQEKRFALYLAKSLEATAGDDTVVWPDHALYILLHAQTVNRVDEGKQRRMFDALMGCGRPPQPGAEPNPMSLAMKCQSWLTEPMAAAGFALKDPCVEDDNYLIEMLARGKAPRVDLLRPGLLLNEDHCAALFKRLFHVDFRHKANVMDGSILGEDPLRQLMTLAVPGNIQEIVANALMPRFDRQPGSWPYFEDAFEQDADLRASVALLVEGGWLDAPTLIRRKRYWQPPQVNPERFEAMMAQIEQMGLEHATEVISEPVRRGLRL